MKIYQKSTFSVKGNLTVCKIDVTAKFQMNGSFTGEEITFSVTGVSKCHKDDEFDKRFGEILAETRASNKVYEKLSKQLIKKYNNIIDEHDQIATDLNKTIYLYQSGLDHEEVLTSESE